MASHPGNTLGRPMACEAERRTETVRDILANCIVHLDGIEHNVAAIDGKLFGYKPECATEAKAACEPPIEAYCLALRERLRTMQDFISTINEKI